MHTVASADVQACYISSIQAQCFDFLCFFIEQFIIGDGNNIYDFTYVENVAHAHICAERALASGGEVAEKAAGQVQ